MAIKRKQPAETNNKRKRFIQMKARKNKKLGPKVGTCTYNNKITVADWYDPCETFTNLKIHMTQAEFLCSNNPNNMLSGFTTSQRKYFGRKLTSYKSGSLQKDINLLMDKKRQFTAIETKIIDYVKLRA